MNVEMTPVAWFCEDDSTLSFAKLKGCACVPLFTEAQLRQAKADALLEAADECDKYASNTTHQDVANNIRHMATELEKS